MCADSIFFAEKGLLFNDALWWETPFRIPKKSLRHALFYFGLADNWVAKHIDFSKYDCLIVRDLTSYPALVRLLRTAKKHHPNLQILFDFPSWPHDVEAIGGLRKLVSGFDRYWRRHALHYADRAIHYGTFSDILGVPTICVSNGIEVTPLPNFMPLPKMPVRLVFVGNISFWHGLDRLLDGLALYYQGRQSALYPDVRLTVVGSGTVLPELKKKVTQGHLLPYVTFVPPVPRDALLPYLQQAHLGIGCLALLRKNMRVCAALKHREYAASGLPFVMAGGDLDFPSDTWFVHTVPDDEKPIDVVQLIDFWENIQLFHPNYSHDIHAFAESNLSWDSKIQPVLSYLGFQEKA